MSWKPDILKAKDLSEKNERRANKLKNGFDALEERATSLDARHARLLRQHFDQELAEFVTLFARIKNVDLEDLVLPEAVPAIRAMTPETRNVSLGAVQGMVSLAGGAAVGASAGALTFAAVGAFAAASTGTAIATLSGAAATSATLAWLGGGALAAGGFGMAGGAVVLGAVVAVPVVLAGGAFLWWRGQRELAQQEEVRAKLKAAKASLESQTALVSALDSAAGLLEGAMERLGRLINARNASLSLTLAENDDYTLFSEKEKHDLMIHVALVMALTSVMSTQLLSGPQTVNPGIAERVAEANDVADKSTL